MRSASQHFTRCRTMVQSSGEGLDIGVSSIQCCWRQRHVSLILILSVVKRLLLEPVPYPLALEPVILRFGKVPRRLSLSSVFLSQALPNPFLEQHFPRMFWVALFIRHRTLNARGRMMWGFSSGMVHEGNNCMPLRVCSMTPRLLLKWVFVFLTRKLL